METTAIGVDAFTSVLSAAQAQISVATVVEVLAIGVGAAVGLVFMWWGVRKLIAMLMKAFTKARLGG